ncbi:MAG: flavodoxin domain-containing protein [Polyangiales bacterium]
MSSIVQTGSFRRGRVLVLYAATVEHTRTNATAIAARIRSHGMIVDVVDASVTSMPAPHDYDGIVLGMPAAFDAHTALIESYISHHRLALEKIPTAVFAATGNADDGFLDELERRLEWRPDIVAAIGDGVPRRSLGWLGRVLAAQRQWRELRDLGIDSSAADQLADRIASRVACAAQVAEVAEREQAVH